MGLLLTSFLAIGQAPGDDAALLRRIAGLVEQLSSDEIDVRERAGQELLEIPARLAGTLEEISRKTPDPEVAARLKLFALPVAWSRVLGGSLREARLQAAALEGPENNSRRQAVAAALVALGERPRDEVAPALTGLLDLPAAHARDFALEGLSRFPPRELGPIVRMLEDPATSSRAAAVLLRAREPSVVPAVLEIFLRGEPKVSSEAGRVLERLGGETDVGRVLALGRKVPALRPTALRIVARSDPARAEEALIALLQDESKESAARDILDAMAKVGGEKSVAALRLKAGGREDEYQVLEEFLATLRDPGLGQERLRAARKRPSEFESEEILQAAAFCGPAARNEALEWLAETGKKLGVQKKVLLLLGAVGRPEDGRILVEKLKDPRLLESAAEGLDLLGHPDYAPDVIEALRRAPHFSDAGQILLGLPPDRIQPALEEILSDPHGYDYLLPAALRLAARRTTPRMRKALFEALEGRAGRGIPHPAEAIRFLAATAEPSDAPAIARLRGHEKAEMRSAGLFLALSRGDREAAAELARFLADQKISSYTVDSRLPFEIAPANVWHTAVLEEWRMRPDWAWGAIALAGAGVPEAQAELRRRLESLAPTGLNPRAIRELALGGDSETLDRLLEHLSQGGLGKEYEDALVARAGEGLKKRLLARAQAHPQANSPYLSVVARMALPEAVPLYLEALAAGTRNRGDEIVHSIRALARLQQRDAIPDIRPYLRSTDPASLAAAISALAELGDRPSMGWIVRLVDDPTEVPPDRREWKSGSVEPMTRIWHAAMDALGKLSGASPAGKSVAERREFWRSWWEKNRESGK